MYRFCPLPVRNFFFLCFFFFGLSSLIDLDAKQAIRVQARSYQYRRYNSANNYKLLFVNTHANKQNTQCKSHTYHNQIKKHVTRNNGKRTSLNVGMNMEMDESSHLTSTLTLSRITRINRNKATNGIIMTNTNNNNNKFSYFLNVKNYHRNNLAKHKISKTILYSSSTEEDGLTVGEDAAKFELSQQSLSTWSLFGVLVGLVLASIYFVWIDQSTPYIGLGLGKDYLDSVSNLASTLLPAQYNPEGTMALLLIIFGVLHSGLASIRPLAEPIVGARTWRVLFAYVSLPLAFSAIQYFIDHRNDGFQLYDLRLIPGLVEPLHNFVWILSLISFLFLYPSTFNLLEIAAVEKPQLHLWNTGIIRITRHPQMVGQGMWCLSHCLWSGNSVIITASIVLMAHHLFACWNGDRRLRDQHGDTFEQVKATTSVWPFMAILDGRQKLPQNYIMKELLRPPYAIVVGGTLAAYLAHPLMQSMAHSLHW